MTTSDTISPLPRAGPAAAGDPGAPRGPARVVELLVGRDPKLRLRCGLSLVAFVAYLLFAAVQHLEVVLGLIELDESNRLTAFNLGGSALLYLAVRTRLSEKLARDPSLTELQMLFALCAITWSYAITGPARGAVMGIMILVILFGVFHLERPAVWRMALAGFVMLGAVMVWRVLQSPARYDARVEAVHMAFGAIVLAATAALAMQLGALRRRLEHQRTELKAALELNRELATRDALTGLLNRRAVTELLARVLPGARHGPAALALLDIDHFKHINDQFGHDAGDAVLARFSRLLAGHLRETDALARWGGEEFLLVMPATTLEQGRLVLERLRAGLAASDLRDLVGDRGVTFSAGLVRHDPGEAQDAVVARADHALYRAKRAGRNRVECDAQTPPAAEPAPVGSSPLGA